MIEFVKMFYLNNPSVLLYIIYFTIYSYNKSQVYIYYKKLYMYKIWFLYIINVRNLWNSLMFFEDADFKYTEDNRKYIATEYLLLSIFIDLIYFLVYNCIISWIFILLIA